MPRSLLFSTSAGIGGHGLSGVAYEITRAAWEARYLGKAVAFSNRQHVIPRSRVDTLWWHPVRLLKSLPRKQYIGARKCVLDDRAARLLSSGAYDLFHSWSGDCLESLKAANRMGIPALLEIPTWHRDKGKVKPRGARKGKSPPPPASRFDALRRRWEIPREHTLEEYDRADLILVLSEKARETFLAAGFPDEKLFLLGRGVDVEKFQPAQCLPGGFHAVFVGSAIRRKGAHLLLEAWARLQLPGARLTIVGALEPAVREVYERLRPPGVDLVGFARDVRPYLQSANLHVFPSECEGSAKVTYEAAACGLAQITTREAGDVVVGGETGWIIPPNNLEALCTALEHAARHPEELERMGRAARARVVEHFTWGHFHQRLHAAHARAFNSSRSAPDANPAG